MNHFKLLFFFLLIARRIFGTKLDIPASLTLKTMNTEDFGNQKTLTLSPKEPPERRCPKLSMPLSPFNATVSNYIGLRFQSGPFPERKVQSCQPILEKMDVGNNMKIHYKVVGNGPKIVLCLPGIIGSIESDFAPIFGRFTAHPEFTIVSWDPPGYGNSRPPDRDFSGDFYSRDASVVSKLMDRLGFDRYAILGWSNGGITGVFLASSEYAGRVTHLVTWGSHSFADDRAVFFSKAMGNLENWSEKMKTPMLALYGQSYLQKMLTDWGNSVEAYQAGGHDLYFKKAISTIMCPTLLIHGELDPVLGIEHAEFLHEHIRNSTLKIFPNGKHNLHLRYTKEFLNLVVPFLLTA